jgi:hypothetical protein
MRQWVLAVGFFIIVLIVIAGCTAPQSGATTGSNNQYPAFENANSIIQCNQPPLDPIRFQSFFPNVPGFTPRFGQKILEGDNYINFTKKNDYSFVNFISDWYQVSDKSKVIVVMFEDLGPCSGDFALDQSYMNTGKSGIGRLYMSGGAKDSYAKKINFHGYPASHAIINATDSFQDIVRISVNNRLFVTITALGSTKEYSVSEADADIEKFANAIDFNAIAMMKNNNPSFARVETTNRPISMTAQYNPDGTITVTNNGGPGTVDLTIITVSVNGGTLRDKLDPQAGSTVTVQGIPGSKNRIIAVGAFRNGTHQVVLETYVGPNP